MWRWICPGARARASRRIARFARPSTQSSLPHRERHAWQGQRDEDHAIRRQADHKARVSSRQRCQRSQKYKALHVPTSADTTITPSGIRSVGFSFVLERRLWIAESEPHLSTVSRLPRVMQSYDANRRSPRRIGHAMRMNLCLGINYKVTLMERKYKSAKWPARLRRQ